MSDDSIINHSPSLSTVEVLNEYNVPGIQISSPAAGRASAQPSAIPVGDDGEDLLREILEIASTNVQNIVGKCSPEVKDGTKGPVSLTKYIY